MQITKLPRYRKHEEKPIRLTLDLMTYSILCRYVLQTNTMVRMEHLNNLKRLMSIIDPMCYQNDPEKQKRVDFINKGLEARLGHNINDRVILYTYINSKLPFTIDFIDLDQIDLTRDEIIYVTDLVSETIQYQFLYARIYDIEDICTRFKTSDFQNRGSIVAEFEALIDDLKNQFRQSKVNDNAINMVFSLRDDKFQSAVTDTYNMITNPSRRLITGMQGFNELTGGGFESGRVYMILGTTGIGKSITLLNIIYQMKKYNTSYRPKDPTKTPCIVLLTMENTVVETITRLFDLVVKDSKGMENYSIGEVIQMLRSQGGLVLNSESPIDIVIRYKANKSVDTSYLYTLCDDLEDDGYEVICLVQDHIKRIRSVDAGMDVRLELGDIVNEFKVFAAIKDIPVITNSHLNREAIRITEDATRKANQDTGKLLGKSNIGESMLMADNLDCGIIITLDFDKESNRYMTFNLVKMRAKSSRMYMAQPFEPGSTIRLVEDLYGVPQFKESIHTMPEFKRHSVIKVTGASSLLDDFEEVVEDKKEPEKTFASTTYTLAPETKREIIKPIEFMNRDLSEEIAEMRRLLGRDKEEERPIICPIIFFDKEAV